MSSLVEIGPVVLEKMIFKIRQCIFAISLLSPLIKRRTLRLNKLDSPSPKDPCLLYTSDAADDMQCVDLGGRRIIKK